MRKSFKKMALAAACAGGAFVAAMPAQAANWLMLQGTERASAVGRAKVWGFVQPEAQYNLGDTFSGLKGGAASNNGRPAAFNMIAPDQTSRATFQIRRVRIGVRGTGFPLDSKVNYFVLTEFGNNGITVPGGGKSAAKLTDASITLNEIPHARIRVGEFKTPGAEEGLQAIHVFDYINFTFVSDQLLLERFFDGKTFTGTTNVAGSAYYNLYSAPSTGVGAFRDIGVQVFDAFKTGQWEHTYAVMVGDGAGINRSDTNGAKDFYGYWSSEQVYGGAGGRREGWKLFGWYQTGKRSLSTTAAGGTPYTLNEYDRTRWGLGTTFRKSKYRATAEYIVANGVIFSGTEAGLRTLDGANLRVAPDGEANGWYVHGGYMALKNLELDVRYDVLNRNTDQETQERKFSKVTLGAQYFFNKKARFVLNYELRNLEVVNPDSIANATQRANAEDIADTMGNVISAQVLAIF